MVEGARRDATRLVCSAALVALVALVVGGASRARADPAATPSEGQAADFAADNPHWHGTSDFVTALRAAGAEVVVADVVDWEAARGASLVLLGPSPGPRPEALRAHLGAGGRVLLGVERARAAGTLRGWGLAIESSPQATLVHAGNAELPFALPTGEHPVTVGSPMVAANHAASLRGRGQALLTFAGPDAGELLVEQEVGAGRLLVLSDPSVLVNNMLEFPGNARLAANLSGYLCARPAAEARCRVIYVAGPWQQIVGLRERLRWRLEQTRRALQAWDQLDLDPARVWLLDVLLVGLCLVALVLLMPAPRPAPGMPPAPSPAPPGWLSRAQALAAPGRHADLRAAASMLAQQAEAKLLARLGPGDPPARLAACLRRYGRPEGGEAGLAGLLADLQELPARDDLYARDAGPVSPAAFRDLVERWERLRAHLDPRRATPTAETHAPPGGGRRGDRREG